MSKENVFRVTCSCGCGDGFEAKAAHGALYVSFFRSDWYAQQHTLRSGLADKMKYMKGERLLREVLISREDLIAFQEFLKSVPFSEQAEEHTNMSHITPMHLLDEIYALWLEGDLPEILILRGRFHQMFELVLSEMDRDLLVVQIEKWLQRESWHAIETGASPHVDRITAGITNDEEESETQKDVEFPEDVEDVEPESCPVVEEPMEDTAEEVTAEDKRSEETEMDSVKSTEPNSVEQQDIDSDDVEAAGDDEVEVMEDDVSEEDCVELDGSEELEEIKEEN